MKSTLAITAITIGLWSFGVPYSLADDNGGGVSAPTDSSAPLTPNKSTQKKAAATPKQRSVPPSMRNVMRSRRQQQGQDSMPASPTNGGATAASQTYQWLPPTAGASEAGSNSAGGMYNNLDMPNSPTRARADVPQSYSSMSQAQQKARQMSAAKAAATPTTQAASKAFSGAQQTSSGVSPYMNLFRNGGGGVDNYSTLVRPELEQRRANQQFGADIHGLQGSTQVQGMAIRRIGQEQQNLQGVGAQQYFMNYGDYYPNAK